MIFLQQSSKQVSNAFRTASSYFPCCFCLFVMAPKKSARERGLAAAQNQVVFFHESHEEHREHHRIYEFMNEVDAKKFFASHSNMTPEQADDEWNKQRATNEVKIVEGKELVAILVREKFVSKSSHGEIREDMNA